MSENEKTKLTAAERLVDYAGQALVNSQPVTIWGGGLDGQQVGWIGCDEESGLISVQLAAGGMVHFLPHVPFTIRVD